MLNKYVGQSEENIRLLFADAEAEYKERGDESDLHIIIFVHDNNRNRYFKRSCCIRFI